MCRFQVQAFQFLSYAEYLTRSTGELADRADTRGIAGVG
jgi:hypothetical protein